MQINPQEYAEASRYESLIKSYPGRPQYILAIMQDLQKQYNYLPRLALTMISSHVGVPVSKIYAMASFYKVFSLTPKGRFVFRVCDGTACHIKGSETLLDQLYQHLGIKAGQTTEDGLFSLETVNCLGACALAPVVVVNGKVYGKVKPGDLEEIIRECGGQCHVS